MGKLEFLVGNVLRYVGISKYYMGILPNYVGKSFFYPNPKQKSSFGDKEIGLKFSILTRIL